MGGSHVWTIALANDSNKYRISSSSFFIGFQPLLDTSCWRWGTRFEMGKFFQGDAHVFDIFHLLSCN